MTKNINKLQFITHELDHRDHLYWVELACKNGINWIQLRLKNKDLDAIKKIALEAKKICDEYKTALILNDYVEIALQINVTGVHIGKKDMPPEHARKILGNQFIIGGTANTFEDLERLNKSGIDYIGLGPYRFTQTKDNLSPVLGLTGYESMLYKAKIANFNIPVIAIGGIKSNDVEPILSTGVFGIAVSSTITKANDPISEIKKLSQTINILENA